MLTFKKEVLATGIKPTGDLTLGNYLGVIKPLISFQKKFSDKYDFYIFIADLHALTFYQEPSLLRERIRKIALFFLAVGLDYEKVNLFVQSEIPQHTSLNYILECNIYMGELQRMIQFKEKKKTTLGLNIRTSLFTYPSLMASDILIYDANIVPVDRDQKQHLELACTIATRFNNLYGHTFVVPKYVYLGHTIKSLTNPSKKMSKSNSNNNLEEEKGCIFLTENLQNIRKKIMRTVTDSENKVRYDLERKPGISNLLTIYAALNDWDLKKTEYYFQDFNYYDFKTKLADLAVEKIALIQKNFLNLQSNPHLLDCILNQGAKKARILAEAKLQQVKSKLGILRENFK